MRYKRMGDDLGLTPEQVEEFLIFTGAEVGDTMQVGMADEGSARWFGASPPDLSLVARSRGVDWLYTFLRNFYPDDTRSSGWNNLLFENTSMPNVLWELQGIREPVQHGGGGSGDEGEDGHGGGIEWEQLQAGAMTEGEYDAAMRDLVTFLEYLSEPSKIQRESMGVWVLLFLSLFAFLAYLLKLEYWKDVH
jgi:ubiquinol-cytochrome c reductase cytochrome c1 subunit